MNLKKLNKYDEEISFFIFNLRNKLYVRKNSLNKKIIKFENHEKWLKKFIKKKNLIYIIFKNKKSIGYIRLELKYKIYYVSWALDKRYHGKGIIKNYLKKVTNKKKYCYFAIIRKNNFASIKVAKYALFNLDIIKNQFCYFYKNKF